MCNYCFAHGDFPILTNKHFMYSYLAIQILIFVNKLLLSWWKTLPTSSELTQGLYCATKKHTSWGGQSWWPMYSELPTSGLPSMWPILRWASVRVFTFLGHLFWTLFLGTFLGHLFGHFLGHLFGNCRERGGPGWVKDAQSLTISQRYN